MISLEHFGASAAYETLYAEFGITPERVAQAARLSLGRVGVSGSGQEGIAMTAQQDNQDVLASSPPKTSSIWLDDISRERLTTGNLAMLARDFHVRGVTSNPTIFAKAMEHGTAYDEQLGDLALRGVERG